MSQPVKLSDALVMEARIEGEAMERSIAGQVEFWARIGKSVEGLLTGQQMRVIGREASSEAVLKRLDTVDSVEGRQRVKDYLASQPYPHYFAHSDKKGLLIREEEDGQRTVGRFINREFVAVEEDRKVVAA
jgi:hypothetical protein